MKCTKISSWPGQIPPQGRGGPLSRQRKLLFMKYKQHLDQFILHFSQRNEEYEVLHNLRYAQQ